ncbi:MAG: hypothetical protein HY903_00540 [Deltaproteobacteria bacterium]|nr:hypothetical protein [Deltaproteobacteria bacterium]
MSISALIKGFQGAGNDAAPPLSAGLPPELLLKEGILSDPEKPDQAYRRARGLAQHGRYKAARDLLCPHSRVEDPALRLKINELLARCAMRGGGGDWEELLTATGAGYDAAGDKLGAARARRDLGEMFLDAGRIEEAEVLFKAATEAFVAQADQVRAAKVECLRARARLRAGYVRRALDRITAAVFTFTELGDGRALALARLERACILARSGDGIAAARDLLAAERYLSSSGSAFDRLRARLARAECLLILGDHERAAHGLKRILVDVVDLEEIPIRAYVHTLLGQALMELDPSAARQALMRGRHLYASVKLDYQVVVADLALARVEHRVGLDARGRLKQLVGRPIVNWPCLASMMSLARAELFAERNPDQARLALFKARSFAADSGDRALLAEVDRVLLMTGLATADEVQRLTPAAALSTHPMVQAGIGAVPGAARPRPEPFAISDVSSDHGVVVRTRLDKVARRINPDTSAPMIPALRSPKVAGVRIA